MSRSALEPALWGEAAANLPGDIMRFGEAVADEAGRTSRLGYGDRRLAIAWPARAGYGSCWWLGRPVGDDHRAELQPAQIRHGPAGGPVDSLTPLFRRHGRAPCGGPDDGNHARVGRRLRHLGVLRASVVPWAQPAQRRGRSTWRLAQRAALLRRPS